MKATVSPGPTAELRSWLPAVREVYRDAFGGPPWYADDAEADGYPARLLADAHRPGFGYALALDDEGALVGFATAWTTPEALPMVRCYPQVRAALGPVRTEEWLCGAVEVDELAVVRRARGRGVARALLDTVTADAPDGRSWLLTSVRAADALRFYRRAGWRQVTHPAPDGPSVAVFLGPHHPATIPTPLRTRPPFRP
ncbi:GNAT family N-acetyltransferase [Streptomyces sp. NPDC005963]|uniref:GNAT family N-acetyltransferase n=1 Tax=Streptomyces sp. NPDC005963 TaxID=3156721 RepID=UPI003404D17A